MFSGLMGHPLRENRYHDQSEFKFFGPCRTVAAERMAYGGLGEPWNHDMTNSGSTILSISVLLFLSRYNPSPVPSPH